MERELDRFSTQLAAASARYVETQVDEGQYGGGWGLREGSEPSVVNTTEVLAILNAQGVIGEPVDRAVTYLTHAIPLHCAKRERGKGRGRNTRFVTFGLLGLAEYEGRLSRPDVADAVRWTLGWLDEHRHEGGERGEHGWPEAVGEEETSLFQTSMAVVALARLRTALEQRGVAAPLPGEAEGRSMILKVNALVNHGVAGLLYHRLSNGAWPRQTYADKGSPSKTSLAVLALASAAGRRIGGLWGQHEELEWPTGGALPLSSRISLGDAIDDGAAWLLQNHERWESYVEPDPDVKGTAWSHLAYALAVRACIRGGADPDDPRLDVARALITSCWSTADASWSEPVDRSFLPTVRASYNVVLTELEVRAAYGRLGRSPAPYRPRARSIARVAERLIVRSDAVETVDETGLVLSLVVSSRRFELIRLLAATDGPPRVVTKGEIAQAMHISPSSVANAIAQTNKAVLRASSGRLLRIIATVDDGYRLAVDRIERAH